jgi:hypothetical protein
VIVEPGHFHAALIQAGMYAGGAPRVPVYAPLGPELLDYLNRIAQFNLRKEKPTRWKLDIQTGGIYEATFRGTRSRIEIRQWKQENCRPELYVAPETAASADEV